MLKISLCHGKIDKHCQDKKNKPYDLQCIQGMISYLEKLTIISIYSFSQICHYFDLQHITPSAGAASAERWLSLCRCLLTADTRFTFKHPAAGVVAKPNMLVILIGCWSSNEYKFTFWSKLRLCKNLELLTDARILILQTDS